MENIATADEVVKKVEFPALTVISALIEGEIVEKNKLIETKVVDKNNNKSKLPKFSLKI